MLYTHIHADVSRNIMTNFKEQRTDFFIKIYLSHFILERVAKGLMLVMCEWWVGDGDRLPLIDPKFFCIIAALLPHSAGLLNRGHWGPKPLVWSWFSLRRHPISNCDWNSNSNWLEHCFELQLTQAVCRTWFYNCLTLTCFLWAYTSAPNSTTSTGQGDIPISSTGCTCYLHRWIS